MHYAVAIGEIERRAKAINLCLKDLARAAGLSPSTAYRGARTGADVRLSTSAKLNEALRQHEVDLLRHLARLYPQEAIAATCPERGQAA